MGWHLGQDHASVMKMCTRGEVTEQCAHTAWPQAPLFLWAHPLWQRALCRQWA